MATITAPQINGEQTDPLAPDASPPRPPHDAPGSPTASWIGGIGASRSPNNWRPTSPE